MVVTDIKNTKIRVESEDHSKAIYKALTGLGFYFRGDHRFVSCVTHYFVEKNGYLTYQNDGDDEFFYKCGGDLIFFYNGEFHDKPQDEISKLFESIKDESEIKSEKIRSLEKGLEKLSALGYEYYQGEWISKEEIEKQDRLEAAYELYKCGIEVQGGAALSYEFFINKNKDNLTGWLAIVDKTGYRKGEL